MGCGRFEWAETFNTEEHGRTARCHGEHVRGRDSSTAWPFRDDNTFSTDDFIRAHHFIVFVLENVAVPNITEFISRV